MNIIFLGGDLRQKYASNYFLKNGYDSECYLDFDIEIIEEKLKRADIISFPIPVSTDGSNLKMKNHCVSLNEIMETVRGRCIILGGKFPNQIKNTFSTNRKIIDYMDIEPFQIQNALLSAEGAIYYAKQRFEKSIHGANIAILGCGRIGKILAYLLRSHGANVTVIARCDINLTWSKLIGYNIFKLGVKSPQTTLNYDIIFNTIPFHIIDECFASKIDTNTIIIDLASYPYGIDEKTVEKYNIKYYRELGIPGRYAPQSAGEIIAKTIINYVLTREDLF